jgi:hypothetical protein
MQVHLSHFLHGNKIASHQEEIVADKKNGWVEVDEEPVEEYTSITPVTVAPAEIKRTWSRRPKKDPQHEHDSRGSD